MPTIDHERLMAAVSALLAAMGSAPGEAGTVAAHLVEANLRGYDSHGVGMIPHYVLNWRDGGLRLNRSLEVVRDDGPFLVCDGGGGGHGQAMARALAERAIDKTRDQGVAVAGLVNAHHIGRVGSYGEQVAEAGLVSVHFVNVAGHGPRVAPFGGSDARFLTNPICIAVPATASRPPIILDFATSRIAAGKVRVAMNKGERLPDGTLIDHRGQPTGDPSVLFREPTGAITTMGDHKGYGLAVMAELLGAALTGGVTIRPGQPRDLGIRNSMLMIVIDPDRLAGRDPFLAEVEALVDYYKGSPPADPDTPVLVAGEPEMIVKAARTRDGIPVDETSWAEICEASVAAGMEEGAFVRMCGQ